MHKKLGVAEPFQKEKFETPSWHVSIKDTALQKEFSEKESDILEGGKLFIKPLGPLDPVLELE